MVRLGLHGTGVGGRVVEQRRQVDGRHLQRQPAVQLRSSSRSSTSAPIRSASPLTRRIASSSRSWLGSPPRW